MPAPSIQVLDHTKVVLTIPCGNSTEASRIAEAIAADVSGGSFKYVAHEEMEDEGKPHEGAKAYPDSVKAPTGKKLKPSDFDLLPDGDNSSKPV